MAAQTSIQQRPKPNIQEDHPATLTMTEVTTENTVQLDRRGAVHDATMLGVRGGKRPVPPAERFTQSTAALACAAILVISALFIAGFMRPQLERTLRRLIDHIEDMDVPLMLPVYIAEAAQELLAERRMVAK